jgi:hypothetical protein
MTNTYVDELARICDEYYCANQATTIERTLAIATALDSISIPGESDA